MIRTILKWSAAPALIAAAAYSFTSNTDASARKRDTAASPAMKSRSAPESRPPANLAEDVLSLRVAALESQLARLPSSASSASETPTGEEPAPAGEPRAPATPLTDEEMRAISDRQRAEYDSMLDAKFAVQNVDPSWAIAAEREARDLLMPLLAEGSSVGELSCRESLCRVEILHARAEGHSESLQKVMDEFDWSGAFSFSLQDYGDGRGSGSTLGFLARQGMALPADGG